MKVRTHHAVFISCIAALLLSLSVVTQPSSNGFSQAEASDDRMSGSGTISSPVNVENSKLCNSNRTADEFTDILKLGDETWNAWTKEHLGDLDKSQLDLIKKSLLKKIDKEKQLVEMQSSELVNYFRTEDRDTGISFEYPCDWSFYGDSKLTSWPDSGVDFGIRHFEVEAHDLAEIVHPNPLSKSIDTKTLSKIELNVIKDEDKIVEKLDLNKYIIDGQKAGTFVYAPSSVELARIVVVEHNGIGYFFTYKTAKAFFTEDLGIMNHIFNSIKFGIG